MFKTLITTIIITTIAFPAMSEDMHKGHDHHDHSGHKRNAELVITPITPSELKAGEENEVILFIQDKQANPVNVSQFEMVHTHPLHSLIIEPRMSDYHHAHPMQRTAGQYVFSFMPQTACSYRMWIDIKLKGSYQHYIPVMLNGAEDCKVQMDKTVNLEASSQGYDFKLELEGDLKAGEAVFANMSISKDGQPVDFLEPVMGAFAHMVGFYEDYETIAHIHPVGKEPKQKTERGGPTLRFHIEPEQEGYLKLFSQVQINGKHIFVPFGLMIRK